MATDGGLVCEISPKMENAIFFSNLASPFPLSGTNVNMIADNDTLYFKILVFWYEFRFSADKPFMIIYESLANQMADQRKHTSHATC